MLLEKVSTPQVRGVLVVALICRAIGQLTGRIPVAAPGTMVLAFF